MIPTRGRGLALGRAVRWALLFAALAGPAWPSTAAAEPPTEGQRQRARDLYKRGLQRMDSGDFAEALASFAEAYDLTADPAMLYNQANALRSMGRYPEALTKLETFEREASAELRAKVPLGSMVEELRAKVTTLTVRSNVAGARVLVRQQAVGTTPLAKLRLAAGPAVVEAIAEGHEPLRLEVLLPGGKEHELELKLVPRGAVLMVDATVAGASVEVDGREVGQVPAEVPVEPGQHRIVLRRDGHQEARSTAVVAAGERKQVRLAMEPVRGVTSRWWFWAGIGAAVVGGVALSVALLTERPADKGSGFGPGQVSAPLLRF